MKKNKMTKEQTNIIYLSAVIFLLIPGKYIFIPVHPPVSFFMIELASVATVLLLVFYVERSIKKLSKTQEQLNTENQSLNITIENLKSELERKSSSSVNKITPNNTFKNIDNLFSNLSPVKKKNVLCNNVLSVLADNFEIVIAIFFIYNEQSQKFSVEGNYGIQKDDPITPFVIGEGLHGEALKEKKVIVLEDLPEDYFSGYSGLGESKPKFLYVLPVVNEEKPIGVIEIASFKSLDLKDSWDEINSKLIELITVR